MKDDLLGYALRVARHDDGALTAGELASMVCAVQMNVLEQLGPAARWALLAEALMSPYPANFFEAMRLCGGLARLWPELDALWGVPHLSDAPEPVDVGRHQMRVVNEAARVGAPLAVRFAALAHKLGMGGTPREIWPSHYKHEQRGQAALDALATGMSVPADAMALARLVVNECDRVHRASDMRAGAIASLLERLQALQQPERFEHLLGVCTCDYAAYEGHTAAGYPKAARLRRALAAYTSEPVDGLDEAAALQARAVVIARRLRGV